MYSMYMWMDTGYLFHMLSTYAQGPWFGYNFRDILKLSKYIRDVSLCIDASLGGDSSKGQHIDSNYSRVKFHVIDRGK